ncbi:Glycoside hydrolase [Cinnamomum micranthum f. kanehirae]|uniref:Glycoside hydrolase n=1 Tax=Cinnamomum micranthum f. kanehirae TaxID=337451 RepID=A0A3S3M580_9MAGN|nr:Glycoside hydrolase [Cinnamomum micranthum f. kanehirae]
MEVLHLHHHQHRATLLLLSLFSLLSLTSVAQISDGEGVPAFPSMPNLGHDPLQPHRFQASFEAGMGGGEKESDQADTGVKAAKEADYEPEYAGGWEMVNVNVGVASMHMQLMPLTDKVIFFDATYYGASALPMPPGNCRTYVANNTKKEDCWAHSVELDINTGKVRPLKVQTDTWCSCGGLAPDGTLVNADGNFIVVGGRRAFSYEFVPKPGQVNPSSFKLPFLRETSTKVEDNLYPFVHLSTDGNLFIFANNRSILLNPTTHTVVHEFPVLLGGPRNYPGSGMSALLPLKIRSGPVPAEVIVCGGTPPGAAIAAGDGDFIPALSSCGRIVITKPNAHWRMEEMPFPRILSDMHVLPNGELLMINGAKKGAAGWGFASDPAMEPVLYKPKMPVGSRFKLLVPTTIPRMYHSTSCVLPDGRVLVAGSNTNNVYRFRGAFPTELRVEKFAPPYCDPLLAERRPKIEKESIVAGMKLKYGEWFTFRVVSGGDEMKVADMVITMYAPPFTTHGYSMNQRLLMLNSGEVVNVGPNKYEVKVMAPGSGVLAPPGYYLMFVVHRALPSEGVWVQIILYCPGKSPMNFDVDAMSDVYRAEMGDIREYTYPDVNLAEDVDEHFSYPTNEVASETNASHKETDDDMDFNEDLDDVLNDESDSDCNSACTSHDSVRCVNDLNYQQEVLECNRQQSNDMEKCNIEDTLVPVEDEGEDFVTQEDSAHNMWNNRTFIDRNSFRKTLSKFAMYKNFSLWHLKTSRTQVTAKCEVQSCPWVDQSQ